jgi:hypothetical protein
MKAWDGQESTHVQAELMTERSREAMSQGPQYISINYLFILALTFTHLLLHT